MKAVFTAAANSRAIFHDETAVVCTTRKRNGSNALRESWIERDTK